MRSGGSRGDAQSTTGMQSNSSVVVPANQVNNFMDTLRGFSESCSESRRKIEAERKLSETEAAVMRAEIK